MDEAPYTTLLEIANFSTKYFILSKVYTVEGGIIQLCQGLFPCMGDNPLTKAYGLFQHTYGQTVV